MFGLHFAIRLPYSSGLESIGLQNNRMKFLKKLRKKAEMPHAGMKSENANPSHAKEPFYQLPRDCQINGLASLYEQYFGRIRDGYFVEFGAYDGQFVSNSSGLADMGWHGLYLEPVPSYFRKCCERHAKNRVKVLPYAVGPREGDIVIHAGDSLSTVDPSMKEHFLSLDWSKGCFSETHDIQAKMKTLEAILTEEKATPGFHLMVVDIEGYEWEALKDFELRKWKPRMVIIELLDQNDDFWNIRESSNLLVHYFQRHNYKVIYKDFTNTIYVPNESYPLPPDKRG